MDEEIEVHLVNQTSEMCDNSTGVHLIKCKWVFKTKVDVQCNIERYKDRLVAKGCSQRYGMDYEETFSPVVRYSLIRLLLAFAVKYNLSIDQMDVITAFLNPELEEDVYVVLPAGYRYEGEICKLKKSIYGLKQASRAWNKEIDKVLKGSGLKQSSQDPCIYFEVHDDLFLIVVLYVDDLLITSNDNSKKLSLKNSLMATFKMKDLGEAHFCLGMKIECNINEGWISLDQKTICDVLEKFGMKDCNEVQSSLDPNQDLFVAIGGGSISWQSRKRNTMAKSTMKAEYMSLSAGASEALWLKSSTMNYHLNKSVMLPCFVKIRVQLISQRIHCSIRDQGIIISFVRNYYLESYECISTIFFDIFYYWYYYSNFEFIWYMTMCNDKFK